MSTPETPQSTTLVGCTPAALLEIREDAARANHYQGLKRLRRELQQEGDDGGGGGDPRRARPAPEPRTDPR